MLRFIKNFALKIGLVYLMTFTGCVSLGSVKQMLLCILLITVSTYIAGFIIDFSLWHTKKSIYSLFMLEGTKAVICTLGLIGTLIFLIPIPIIIMNLTSGILVLYDNVFIKLAVVLILWLVGNIKKNKIGIRILNFKGGILCH